METIFFFIPEHLGKALGWMVLHTLWQATLIGFIAGILMVALRHRPARVRYWTANGALLLILLAAVGTFGYYYKSMGLAPLETGHGVLYDSSAPVSANNAIPATDLQRPKNAAEINMANYFSRHLPLIVALWFLGMSMFLLRLLGNIGYIYYLKNHLNFPVEQFWDDLLQGLVRKTRIGAPISLLESALVRTPMVIGYLKPVILFPIGMINRLDPANVEAILAHELAHIAHRDYLFNILQSIVEALFYFHPAVWWLSSRIRHEREIAADDAAVRLTGNSIEYAKALVIIQDMAFMPLSPSLAFAGQQKRQLIHRVHHILHIQPSTNLAMEKFIGTCAILLVLLGLGYAQNKNTTSATEGYAQTGTSGNALSGIWEGTIKDDKVCINLSSRSEHSSWINGDCYLKSEFSSLPTVESEFSLSRPAGTITFKGKFENNEGYGRFRFAADQGFSTWLKENGISGIDEEAMVHLFFANIDKDYVLSLKKSGYDKISGEDLQNMAIHGLDPKNIAAYQALSKSLGEGQPSIEIMLNLSIHDIDQDYIKSLTQAGFPKLSTEEIMNAKIHDLSPEYIKQCSEMGFDNLTFEDVLNFKIHDITPAFLNDLKKSGIGPLSAEEALNMRIHDLSPAAIAEFKKMGFADLSSDDLLNLKIHEITPAFLDEMRKSGFDNLSAEDAINLKIHGITPAFIDEMRKTGFDKLSAEDAINLKIHDINAEFVRELNNGGFRNLSVDDAVNCKIHGVNSVDLSGFAKLRFTKIDVDDAVNLKIHEVTPAFIKSMRSKGFTDLDLEEYVNLKIQYGRKNQK